VAVVPNGVDPELWADPPRPPDWWLRLPGPRLLYIGTLDRRLDVEAAVAVARAWPRGTVVLVGRRTEPERLRAAAVEPNVVIHDAVGRDQVAALAHAADVCLLPHRRTALTEAMSPLKLYEYLASGSPIVATDLEPVRRAGGPIVRVEPVGDFVAAVRDALALDPVPERERLALISRNSWARRSAQVKALALAE
jgi:glycosyltransferase involved in cell wall biosynthesis